MVSPASEVGVILRINLWNFAGVPQYFPRFHDVSKRDEVGSTEFTLLQAQLQA